MAQNSDNIVGTPNKYCFKSLPTEEEFYASISDASPSVHPQTSIKDDDGWEVVENEEWELVWDRADQAFHFYNHFTHAKEKITASHTERDIPGTVLLLFISSRVILHAIPPSASHLLKKPNTMHLRRF